eukprot:Skav227832  [mRNA]  locus=scaffold948:391182:404479:+ [translate_table: standard]
MGPRLPRASTTAVRCVHRSVWRLGGPTGWRLPQLPSLWYIRGQGQWYELAQIHGVRVFRPKWIGPQGRDDWTAAYVQQEVRGRGEGREPYDLLVTDGTAIARLRHGTLRGRTNRFGFRADCDSVHASSHRYYRNQLEGMECKVHLCAQRPCGQPDDDCLHAVASAVIPRHLDFDLQDAAGKGPLARCATAAWLCGYSTCGLCGNAWKTTKRCLACVFCSGCLCKRRNKTRNRLPPSSEASTPRHENSETESEAEGELCCQAEAVAFVANGKPTPLSLVPCKDAARGDKVKLLPSDAEVSSAEDLKHEDGQYYFNSCHHHRALYEGQAAKRTCVYEGCDREVKASKGGLRLCKLHGAKEERVRPSSKMKSSNLASKATPIQTPLPEPEARFAPGLEAQGESLPKPTQASPQATVLGKYLRAVLDGQSEPEALQTCANSGCGPRETWEDLKDQATAYVARLPRDYPVKARKAIVNLVTEDCPLHEWPQETTQDPVLGLGVYAAAGSGERIPERNQLMPPPAVEVLPTVTRPPQAPEGPLVPNVMTLYRPRGSTALPEGLTLGPSSGQPNAYHSFAAAARPRHIGAYTDGEPPRMDETTKALQAIAKAVTSKDEAASHDKGKLASIGKVEERLIYLVRGCDALTVPLGKATVGKELFHSLRATSTQGRPQLRVMQFPVNINNRVAYGLASMSIGGKDTKSVPEFCLSVADFPLTSEEEFDGWVGCTDMKLEKRPKPPMTLNAWYRNALRESWAVACVYGSEHYSSFEQAASFLLKLGEDHAYMWPAHAIFSVWEELWSRYVEELKDLDRELRRAMKEEAPTFERIRFFVTAPGDDGEPWLRLPRTFFLEDGNEYFQTDVIPRHNRMLSRACWQVALKKGPSGGLYGGKAGEGPEASDSRPGPKTGKADTTSKGLLGPPLTNKEAARALDHRPKEKKGARYLCWDHLCHRGCAKPTSCPHSHGAAPKWEQIDWAVQLQLLRRGGLKGQPKLSESQVSEQMDAIRKAQHQKTQDMISDGKKIKKVGEHLPNEIEAESKVGQQQDARTPQEAPPAEFTNIYPTDQEAELTNLLEGPDFTFFEDHDGGKHTREASLLDPGCEEVERRKDQLQHVDQTSLAEGFDGLLKTYVKNQLLLKKEDDPTHVLGLNDVRAALEQARVNGCPALSTAADEALQGAQMCRAGYSPNVGHLSTFQWNDEVGQGLLTWAGGAWEVWDYGDKLYPTGHWTKELLSPESPSEGPEARQCLLLHCAAGYLHSKTGKIPQWHEVQRCTNELRAELVQQASEASRHLGECPEVMPRSEADLRVFVHDLLHWSHDKDYRTLASFPAGPLLDKTLYIVRMASDYDLSTEVITGALSSGHPSQQIHLLVHQGHMRLLIPKGLERNPPTIREVIAAGWECHLEAADGSEASVRARDYLACPRCSQAEEVPRRSGTRPPSVLGLHLRSDASDKIGAWTPGNLELQDVPADQWSDSDLRTWLGPQADTFDRALSSGLDFLEVYAGKARASQAVLSRGGCAIYLGIDHGHDFRRARDRSLAVALVRRLKPRHLWGAFPCTPFCAWIRLAMLRNCDMTHRLKEGRLHLRFILQLCGLQLEDLREAHLENPLTSMAWKEPLSLEALADPRWLRARLDQYQTGLSSPTGGLHLKPTLIRTTDPLMQSTLSLTCPRDHPHDPVEGAATAMSAMYSPHMADLIAQVVLSTTRTAGLPLPVDAVRGGDGAAFSFPAVRVGGSEASFSPGQSNSNASQWFEGLKCDGLKGPLERPLKPDVEQACKAYLNFVSSEPYSKETFKKGAELGTKVLNEAGGWKEANRGIRRTWMLMKGDHFEGLHSDFFEGLVAPNLLEKARENAIWGISARYEGGVGNRVQCGPHPSLKEHLEEAAQQLWKDAAKGRVLLCFDEGGDELHGVVSVAMARVPKMLPNRTVSDKGRVIWDAKPINEFCDKSRHPPALQPKHDEVARLIVWWQTRFPNTPILLSKKDVSDAFKWVPVRCEDTRLFAADLPGGEFGAHGKNITVLYNSLTFGWTGAPGEYMLFAWLIKSGHSMFHPPDPLWNDGVAFQSLVLMDDAVLIEPKIGLRPWLSVQTMETCTKMALGLAQPRGDAEQRRRTWIRFWEAIELQRLLVDNRSEWGVRFTHPMTEALSIRELLAMPGNQQRVVWASGDATLERIGAVDWSNKQAYALEVAPYQKLIEEMEKEALEDVNYPRRWQRRALVWAGQADADCAQACRLAEARKPSNLPKPLAPGPVSALDVNFLDLGEISNEYVAALHSSGARLIEGAEGSPRRVSRPDKLVLACITLVNPGWKEHVHPFLLTLNQPDRRVDLLWADSRDRSSVEELEVELRKRGFATTIRSVCGRSLLDQVWWKRWIVTASKDGEKPYPWVLTEDEPCTPPLAGYPLEWLIEDEKIEADRWEPGLLKLDSSMPYLGATKPKPIGTLMRPREGRALVWDPRKPLPGLHEGSADVNRKDRLLLLGKGPDGPAARAIMPAEVIQLTGKTKGAVEQTTQEDVKRALSKTPRALCESAVGWASSQVGDKVGVCKLQWEEESRNILDKWLNENPAGYGAMLVGGKTKKSKNKGLPVNERAMKAMSYVLRHSAGTESCPITEEGWVRWDDLRRHESCQPYDAWTLWDAIEADAKDRVVASQDADGEWWIAAWSGHTQERVVGPAAVVPVEELPKVLTHGSYRRHTASIQKKGLLRQTRDLHFHDPESRTGKWRLDLETCVKVNVKLASEHGCVFRRTGNDVWLCDRDVPPAAILSITEWDKPRDVPPSGMLFDLKKREESRRGGKGGASSSAAGSGDYNSAALDIPAYRPWQPKSRPNLVTEEIASTAYEIGKNLPENLRGGIEIDPNTEAIRPRQLAACIAPGGPGEEEECDWSADDSDVEVVKATPAVGTEPKIEEEDEDTSMEDEEGDEGKAESPQAEKTEVPDVEMEGTEEPSSSRGVKTLEPEATAMEGTEEPSSSSKGVETLGPKAEEFHEEAPEPVRRRKIKFGSAHLQLLRAVADADAHNWESLQTALNSTPSSAKAKSELVERLEHLADLRVKSLVDAERSAQEHAKRAKHYTEAETQYQRGLNDAMLRLERMNPVGPRTAVPLVSDARLRQDIESGTPIWVARRAHRARERAARRRLDEPRTTMDASQPSALTEVPPEEGGQMLDDAFAASAKANLTEFKKILKEEAKQEKDVRKRKPDSERRKKLKKERRRARKANTKDDAVRDQNHAIAHRPTRSEASFSPGLQGVVLAAVVNLGQSKEMTSAGQEKPMRDQGNAQDNLLPFDLVSGVVFDLVAVTLVMLAFWVTRQAVATLRSKILRLVKGIPERPRTPSPSRRVGVRPNVCHFEAGRWAAFSARVEQQHGKGADRILRLPQAEMGG